MSTPRDESSAGADRVLRAKYLDWCSARLADRLFRLPPEEIYQLARAREAGGDFRAIVGQLTEAMTREMGLPDFGEWRQLYAESPEHFDEEMIGFWKEAAVEPRG